MVMQVFGLTGGIACGKSTAAAIIQGAKIPIIDADVLAREVMADHEVLGQVVSLFGSQIMCPEGLDRKLLGLIVFGDQSKREALNSIVHPRVAQLFETRVEALKEEGHTLACYDVPLLFENGLEAKLYPTILVVCHPDQQVSRLMNRNGLSREEAAARIAAQMPLEAKIQKATYMVRNTSDYGFLEEQLRTIIDRIKFKNYLARIGEALGVPAQNLSDKEVPHSVEYLVKVAEGLRQTNTDQASKLKDLFLTPEKMLKAQSQLFESLREHHKQIATIALCVHPAHGYHYLNVVVRRKPPLPSYEFHKILSAIPKTIGGLQVEVGWTQE